jgi:hypothetical protein
MTEFNLLVSLVEAAVGRRPTIQEINEGFDFSAALIMAPTAPVRTTAAAQEKSDKTASATTVAAAGDSAAQRAAPASCRGSVKKGVKAFNSGSFEVALCHWLPKARAGDAAAQNNIGLLFERGLTADTPQSDEEAAAWFRLAADQGFTLAMRNLAGVHSRRGAPGDSETASAWIALADATDAENRLVQEQQRAQALAVLAAGLACALGGCSAPAPAYQAASPSVRYGAVPEMPSFGFGAARPNGGVRPLDPAPAYGLKNRDPGRTGSGGAAMPGSSGASSGMRLCPDGSYVSGTCNLAPDGTYVGGRPQLTPNGTYVEQGRVRLAPNGTYVGGNGRMILCPDGTYVTGERCRLTPAGTYIGQ